MDYRNPSPVSGGPHVPRRLELLRSARSLVLGRSLGGGRRPNRAGQEPIRLLPQPVTITPAFAPEGLPNQFEEGAALPAAMSTTGGGDTWIACLAYSPDGSTLAVGDRPTRPLCTFLGDAPVNQNGGLIRIIDIASRRVTRTIRPDKRPRHEYEVVSLAYTPDGRKLLAHGIEGWPGENGSREYGYHVTAFDAATGRGLRRIDSAKLDDWKLPVFSRDASTFAALTHAGTRVWDIATGRERPAPEGAPTRPAALALSPDARVLAAGDKSGEFCLWDAASGRRIARFPGHRKDGNAFEVEFLTFSPDGQMLACGSQLAVEVREFQWEYHSEFRLVNMATHTERTAIPGRTDRSGGILAGRENARDRLLGRAGRRRPCAPDALGRGHREAPRGPAPYPNPVGRAGRLPGRRRVPRHGRPGMGRASRPRRRAGTGVAQPGLVHLPGGGRRAGS